MEPCNDYSYGIAPETTPETETPVQTTDVYVTTGINVRSSQSTDSEVIGLLSTGDKISVSALNVHYPSCPSVDQMKAKNRLDSIDNIIAMGYVPCKSCNP